PRSKLEPPGHAGVPDVAWDELQALAVHHSERAIRREEGEPDETGIVVGVTGGEREAFGKGRQVARLDLHPLEALAAGVGQGGLAVDVPYAHDRVLEDHVEEGDIEGERSVEPPRLEPHLARARPLRIEDLRGFRLRQVRRGGLEGAPGRDVDVEDVEGSGGTFDRAEERGHASRELPVAAAVVDGVEIGIADYL